MEGNIRREGPHRIRSPGRLKDLQKSKIQNPLILLHDFFYLRLLCKRHKNINLHSESFS